MLKKISPKAIQAMQSNYKAQIEDETLRDGLQDANVKRPTPDEALALFHLMHQVGTHGANIGFANAGKVHHNNILKIAKYNACLKYPIDISCAARMKLDDVKAIVEISQKTGTPIRANTFIDSDPTRINIEGWETFTMIKWIEDVVGFARANNTEVMIVTENTIFGIQKNPVIVEQFYLAGLNKGATRVCITDTTGCAHHREVEMAVLWMQQLLNKNGFHNVKIDFHGHNDLGCAVSNSIAALEAGAQRVHTTILGLGERCGNTDRTTFQLQLRRIGLDQGAYNLKMLPKYALKASQIFGAQIPENYPGLGKKSRTVVAGTHAGAVLKAYKKLPEKKASKIYFPVNYLEVLGLKPSCFVKIGCMAGLSNVYLWGKIKNIEISESQAKKIIKKAKQSQKALTDEEILRLLK